MLKNGFIDWLTISQFHQVEKPLPLVHQGVRVDYNAEGLPVFERASPKRMSGSFETSVRVSCNGYRVFLSGNVGRFSRKDNLFGFGIRQTIERANSILSLFELPPFTPHDRYPFREKRGGAVISRLDFTVNYSAGSEYKARQAVNWLSGLSVARVKKGRAGDESYWFANTRWMFKAYIKHLEMLKHGIAKEDPSYIYAAEQGILRLEIELKKRLLSDMNMNYLADITDDKLQHLFDEQTSFARKYHTDNYAEAFEHIPLKSRIYAESWLKGINLKNTVSNGTLYRHAKILREYGIDILADRNIEQFPVQVRIVDLIPCAVPDWYQNQPDDLIKKVA
jgi:hypothetical protein